MEYPEMIKDVKKWGDSYVLRLNADDLKLYNIKLGTKIKFKIIEVENTDGTN